VQATGILGVPRENLYFLNFEDGYLNSYEQEARFPVKVILEQIRPSEVYIDNDPLGDHGTAKRIVLHCLSELEMKPLIYEYFAHGSKEDINKIQDKIAVDISSEIDTKLKALQAYVTEITLYAKGQKEPIIPEEDLKRFREPVEYFIRRQ
jgi:LmbE family N-acetylglucosaminyl deacetylase